jgi:S-adenosylmethionine:tRNA ribosyltransferase-isomerase
MIEIFCLEPHNPSEYNAAFNAKGSSEWKCVVGNIKRFKEHDILDLYINNDSEAIKVNLQAQLINREDNEAIIKFSWYENYSFSSVLDICGKIPIPPYLKRESMLSDAERYQTIYASNRGSVAAPTAGLHFTTKVLENIKKQGIKINELSLHVGAGTFIPVKSELITNHKMHSEPIIITKELVENLLKIKKNKSVISVGTTSARTLESLYYLGLHCLNSGSPGEVGQWEPYNLKEEPTLEESLHAIITWFNASNNTILSTKTQIIIVPGFKFRIVDILITNFHQPQSTLLLLIAAFIGDSWKEVYDYALKNNFRFLSYGDSCLFFKR